MPQFSTTDFIHDGISRREYTVISDSVIALEVCILECDLVNFGIEIGNRPHASRVGASFFPCRLKTHPHHVLAFLKHGGGGADIYGESGTRNGARVGCFAAVTDLNAQQWPFKRRLNPAR